MKSLSRGRDLIVGLLNEVPGVKCQVPGGAFYVWPNVTEACRRIGAADSEEFRKRLLHEAGVAVLADIHFGTRVPGEGQHVRFSYAASKQAIEAGVQRMADFIRKNTRKRHEHLEALGDGRGRHRAHGKFLLCRSASKAAWC